MYTDGEKNSPGVRGDVVLKSPEGAIFEHYFRLNFFATNNEIEYLAFIVGLWSISKLKIPKLFSLLIQSWWAIGSLENSKLGESRCLSTWQSQSK